MNGKSQESVQTTQLLESQCRESNWRCPTVSLTPYSLPRGQTGSHYTHRTEQWLFYSTLSDDGMGWDDWRNHRSVRTAAPSWSFLLPMIQKFINYLDSMVYGVGLPGVVMVVVVVTTIVTTLRLRKAATWRSESSSGTLSSREVALTKMLIGSSILFIVCVSPIFLFK